MARTAAPQRTKRGKLWAFNAMPLDVLCEIVGFLTPLELLSLSRTSKELRALFLSTKTLPMWKAAIANVGLPECPSFISEPKYSSLIFDKSCQICGRNVQTHLTVSLRVRECGKCSSPEVADQKELEELYGDFPFEITRLLPGSPDMLDAASILWPKGGVLLSLVRHRRDEFEEVFEVYSSLESKPDERKQYVEERKKLVKRVKELESQVWSWQSDQKNAKRIESEKKKEDREKSIRSKLMDLGYSEKDLPKHYCIEYADWTKLVKQDRELTPRIWSNIRPKLETLIVTHKSHFWRELQRDKFFNTLERTLILGKEQSNPAISANMSGRCLLSLPIVRSWLEKLGGMFPFTDQDWLDLENQVVDAIVQYQDRRQVYLGEEFAKAYQDVVERARIELPDLTGEKPQQHLLNAAAFFTCRLHPMEIQTPDEDCASKCEALEHATCNPSVLEAAYYLLKSLDLPPLSTIDDLETRGDKFSCLCCDQHGEGYTWTEIVLHFYVKQSTTDSAIRQFWASKATFDVQEDTHAHRLEAEQAFIAFMD